MTTLQVLQDKVSQCTKCSELAESRTQTVFADGNPNSRIFVIGEAPGADEDKRGVPFVGRAGKLFNNILTACGLTRDDIYIANILKCRPPGNRNPQPDEAANCREYLDAQIDFVNPEFILSLGAVASQNLLGVDATISSLRGIWHSYKGANVLCTYHPAYVMRAGKTAKQKIWQDLQLLLVALKKPLKKEPKK